jgi:hypothetical protein
MQTHQQLITALLYRASGSGSKIIPIDSDSDDDEVESKNMPHVSKQVSSNFSDGMITHTTTFADKIAQVANITGVGLTEAENALEMSAGDVKIAIELLIDSKAADPPSVSRKSSCSEVVEMESTETRPSRHNKRFMDASKMDKNLFSEMSGGIQNGVACPECNNFIFIKEAGCNVTTCRYNQGHANGQWYHFCFYCKKQTEFPTGHGALPLCPERVDKATRMSYYQKKGQSGIITTQGDVENEEDNVENNEDNEEEEGEEEDDDYEEEEEEEDNEEDMEDDVEDEEDDVEDEEDDVEDEEDDVNMDELNSGIQAECFPFNLPNRYLDSSSIQIRVLSISANHVAKIFSLTVTCILLYEDRDIHEEHARKRFFEYIDLDEDLIGHISLRKWPDKQVDDLTTGSIHVDFTTGNVDILMKPFTYSVDHIHDVFMHIILDDNYVSCDIPFNLDSRLCGYCSKKLTNPIRSKCCTTMFCKECYHERLTSSYECLVCGSDLAYCSWWPDFYQLFTKFMQLNLDDNDSKALKSYGYLVRKSLAIITNTEVSIDKNSFWFNAFTQIGLEDNYNIGLHTSKPFSHNNMLLSQRMRLTPDTLRFDAPTYHKSPSPQELMHFTKRHSRHSNEEYNGYVLSISDEGIKTFGFKEKRECEQYYNKVNIKPLVPNVTLKFT